MQNVLMKILKFVQNHSAMFRLLLLLCVAVSVCCRVSAGSIDSLLERIDSGLSQKIIVDIVPGQDDFFEITQSGLMPKIVANNKVRAAAGCIGILNIMPGSAVLGASVSQDADGASRCEAFGKTYCQCACSLLSELLYLFIFHAVLE